MPSNQFNLGICNQFTNTHMCNFNLFLSIIKGENIDRGLLLQKNYNFLDCKMCIYN